VQFQLTLLLAFSRSVHNSMVQSFISLMSISVNGAIPLYSENGAIPISASLLG